MLPLSMAKSVNCMNKGKESHHLLGPYDEPGIALAYLPYIISFKSHGQCAKAKGTT